MQKIAFQYFRPKERGPLLCLNSFQIISLQQGLEYRLQRGEDVFTIKDCMRNTLCESLAIGDREVLFYVGQVSTLPGPDRNGPLYSSQTSSDLLWRVIQVVCCMEITRHEIP
ncbi:hypothetical protein AVEN_263349-1 [Araneus ventricosus]|uniref:Uncharacterized protein n=1 Tax=Araneus ventricosus TaxID=182803 RepID=A0A4Y2D4F3_ARAVE|nr:hypothetical protein AVEN_263349-1 [Araneus ventricosus]